MRNGCVPIQALMGSCDVIILFDELSKQSFKVAVAKTFGRGEDAEDFKAQLRRKIIDHEYHAPVKNSYGEWVGRHLSDLENSPDIDVAPKTIDGNRDALQALGIIRPPKNTECHNTCNDARLQTGSTEARAGSQDNQQTYCSDSIRIELRSPGGDLAV